MGIPRNHQAGRRLAMLKLNLGKPEEEPQGEPPTIGTHRRLILFRDKCLDASRHLTYLSFIIRWFIDLPAVLEAFSVY